MKTFREIVDILTSEGWQRKWESIEEIIFDRDFRATMIKNKQITTRDCRKDWKEFYTSNSITLNPMILDEDLADELFWWSTLDWKLKYDDDVPEYYMMMAAQANDRIKYVEDHFLYIN